MSHSREGVARLALVRLQPSCAPYFLARSVVEYVSATLLSIRACGSPGWCESCPGASVQPISCVLRLRCVTYKVVLGPACIGAFLQN